MYACDHNYVCMFICVVGGGTYTMVFRSLQICVFVRVHVYMYVCSRMDTCMYACDHVCMFICVVGGGTCTYTMVFRSPYYRCVFVRVHVYMYVCSRTDTCMYACNHNDICTV